MNCICAFVGKQQEKQTMKSISILAACAALYATGCAFDGKDYTFVVNDPVDYDAAKQAVDMWQKCGVVNITLTSSHDNTNGVVIDLNHDQDLWCSGTATLTQIRFHRTPHTYSLLGHEMGHVFGLKHSKSEDDIMSADLGSLQVSDNDCQALLHRSTYYTNDSSD
jgi:hypothetical protein